MRQLKITQSITPKDFYSFDLYLSEIKNEERVSAEEEVELAQQIRNGDEKALNKLVKANLRFVISVAKQYQGRGISLIDLVSEGNLGLITAARRFDETRGFKFISYAVWWIRQRICASLAQQTRTIRLPLNVIGNIKKVNKAVAEFQQVNERDPNNDELVEMTDLTEEIVDTCKINSSWTDSIDRTVGESENVRLSDLIESNHSNRTDESLLIESRQFEINNYLSQLKPLEKEILEKYFGLNSQSPQSLPTIASMKNISSERVRQIKNKALSRMKKLMKSSDLLNSEF